MKTSLVLGSAMALTLLTSTAFASKLHFVAPNVTDAAEVVESPVKPISAACKKLGDCSMSFTYDTVTHILCGSASFQADLDVTGSHLHKGGTEMSGPVLVSLAAVVGNTKSLNFLVNVTDAAVQTELVAAYSALDQSGAPNSTIYFNVHTQTNQDGDARGNVRKDVVNPDLDECAESTDAGADAAVEVDDGGGVTTTPTDGGAATADAGTTPKSNSDTTSSCSTAPGTSPGSVMLMLGAAIAVGSIVRSRKKRPN